MINAAFIAGIMGQQHAGVVVPPVLVVTYKDDASIAVGWGDIGDGSETEYRIYQDGVLIKTLTDTNIKQSHIAGLAAGTQYSVEVRAFNGAVEVGSGTVVETTNAGPASGISVLNGDEIETRLNRIQTAPVPIYTGTMIRLGATLDFTLTGGRGNTPVSENAGRIRILYGDNSPLTFSMVSDTDLTDVSFQFSSIDDPEKRLTAISPSIISLLTNSNVSITPTIRNSGTEIWGTDGPITAGEKINAYVGDIAANVPFEFTVESVGSIAASSLAMFIDNVQIHV